jgi:tRNA U55 pseudouridine synthase TruB
MKFFTKPVGLTPNDLKYALIKEGKLSNKSCCFGRLDPMARGIEPFLEDDEVKNMDKYLFKSDKEYEAELVIGISTDTDDNMGLCNNINLCEAISKKEKIKNMIFNEFNKLKKDGQCKQKYHPFSSYMLRKDGFRKPLWEWTKMNQLNDNEIPEKDVNLYEIDILEDKVYNKNDIITEFSKRVGLVDRKHKFRQEEIIKQWEDLKIKANVDEIYSIKFKIKVSSGYYIRQLCYDLKKKIDFPLMIYDINRTNIYLKEKSI